MNRYCMTLGEVARMFDVRVITVKKWIKKGLLEVEENTGLVKTCTVTHLKELFEEHSEVDEIIFDAIDSSWYFKIAKKWKTVLFILTLAFDRLSEEKLSEEDRDIVRRFLKGEKTKDIAKELNITQQGVSFKISSIMNNFATIMGVEKPY